MLCGSCRHECPSRVDIPKLAAEARARYAREFGVPLQHRLLTGIEQAVDPRQQFTSGVVGVKYDRNAVFFSQHVNVFGAGNRAEDGRFDVFLMAYNYVQQDMGAEVQVGIRPEDYEDASLAPEVPEDQRITSKITLVEALGAEIMAHFSVDAPTVDSGDPDARILTATHQDLASMVEEGAFRRDLFYRINVIELTIPSLRERQEDIPLFVEQLLHNLAEKILLFRQWAFMDLIISLQVVWLWISARVTKSIFLSTNHDH